MSKVLISEDILTKIADRMRTCLGFTEKITPIEMTEKLKETATMVQDARDETAEADKKALDAALEKAATEAKADKEQALAEAKAQAEVDKEQALSDAATQAEADKKLAIADTLREFIAGDRTTYSDDQLTKIRKYAFAGCDKLTSVDLPNVVSADSEAFYSCSKLANVNLPLLATAKGANAFAYCSELTKIELPSFVGTSYIVLIARPIF